MFRQGQLVSGRFRIASFLGEGGMGEVYAAEDQELHITVALKTLHPHLAGSPKFAQRFKQEIHLARQVTHPNVCRIFDAGRHEGTLYFTMELLEGETLARRLETKGRMSPLEAAPIVRQLCDALSAAHRSGVLHRDFKSANVMLAGTRAVITDFGLARLLEADALGPATTGVAVGTPAYMPPEQIEGRPSGPSVDIYALGVVMYEMVTGARPYCESSPLALAAAKLKALPPPPRKTRRRHRIRMGDGDTEVPLAAAGTPLCRRAGSRGRDRRHNARDHSQDDAADQACRRGYHRPPGAGRSIWSPELCHAPAAGLRHPPKPYVGTARGSVPSRKGLS